MANKMTQRDYFNALLAIGEVSANADLVDFINGRIAQLDKKANTAKAPTKTQKENEGIKASILAEMEVGQRYSITDMIKHMDSCKDLSNQKVSALLKQLVAERSVVRVEDKRKVYFELG